MTISDSLDKLPGVTKVQVDVENNRLSLKVQVADDSPAHSIFKTCGLSLIGGSLGLVTGPRSWFSLPITTVPKDGAETSSEASPEAKKE